MSDAPTKTKKEEDPDAFMQKARDSLLKQREEIATKRDEIDKQLDEVDQKLARIDSYFNPQKPTAPAPRKTRAPSTGTRAPRGEHRTKIAQVLKENPNGLSGGEIIDKLGIRSDKKAMQATANALANMKKGNELRTEGAGKATRYFPVDNA